MIKDSVKNKSKFLAMITLVGILGGYKVVNAEEGEEVKNINIISISNIENKEANIDTNIIENINKIQNENIENRLFISSIKNLYRGDYEYSYEEKSNMIAANIVNSEDDSQVFNPYIVKEINGINIGIIGIYRNIDTELNNESQFIRKDEVEVINKYSEELKSQGINNIIVLSDIPAITDEYEQIIDMNEEIDIYDIYNNIDEEVDIIISESDLNNGSSNITLQRELGSLELVRSNINENYLIDMDIHMNEEKQLFINEVKFVASEFKIEENNEGQFEHGENKNSDIDDSLNNNEEEENLKLSEDIEVKNKNIQARVVGGTNQNTPNSNNNNTNENEPDEDDKAEKNDEDEDKDEEKKETKKDEDEENKNKSNGESTNNKSINPKTGDVSIVGYIAASITSIVGLGLNLKYKKK